MSVEQPDSALTDDEWLAQLLEPPQLPNPPQQPSHDISILPNYYDSLDHDIHIDRDLDLSLPLPPACFSTNSSLSAPPQAHSIGSFPVLSSSAQEVSGPYLQAPHKCTISSPRPGQGQGQGQGQGEVGFSQIVDTCFTEGRRSGNSLLQYILRNRAAHGIPPSQVGIALSAGATAFRTGMERSGFKLRNDSTLTAPTHPIQHGSCAVANERRDRKPLTPIERNIEAFNADRRVQNFPSALPNASEIRPQIRNWDATTKTLGRGGSVLAKNLIDRSGTSPFSADRDAEDPKNPFSVAEQIARGKWREVLRVLVKGGLLFLEKDKKWDQQREKGREAAIKFLEMQVEETRFCGDHQRAVALCSYGLSLSRGKYDWIKFEASMLPEESSKRPREEETLDAGEEALGDSQATKKQRGRRHSIG